MVEPSQACIDLIKRSEGCSLTAYPDNGAYSIGYGHRGVPAGTVWTQQQAEQALADDAANAAAQVNALVKVPLTQGQFDALVDFCFNLGSGNLARSTLLASLNAGRYNAVPDMLCHQDPETGEWHGWVFSAGEVNMGLVARRQSEIALWKG